MVDPLVVATEPTRWRLVQVVVAAPRTVGEIAAERSVIRSAASQHLLKRADAGLVEAEQQAHHRIYRAAPNGLRELRAALDGFWNRELDQLATEAHTRRRQP